MRLLVHPDLLKSVFKHKMGLVTHHAPTETNTLGQSGTHTFVNDLMDIVLASDNESCARDAICLYLHCGDTNVHRTSTSPPIVRMMVRPLMTDSQVAFAVDIVKIFWSFNTEREIWKALHQYLMGELTEVN